MSIITFDDVAREATVRAKLDADRNLPEAERYRPDPLLDMLAALEGFGYRMTAAAKKTAKLLDDLAREFHQARFEAALIRERMAKWERDQSAWDVAAVLAAGSWDKADLWDVEPHDLERLEYRVKVLDLAVRMAATELRQEVYGDPKLDEKVESLWRALATPGDLKVSEAPTYRAQAMATATVLRGFATGHAKFEGVAPRTPEDRELRRRLKVALDGELGEGRFPMLFDIERERAESQARLRAAEAEVAEAESRNRERLSAESQASAAARNPGGAERRKAREAAEEGEAE